MSHPPVFEKRYALRLKDDFAVRDTILALHEVFTKLRIENNRLRQLCKEARSTSHVTNQTISNNACVHVLGEMKVLLTVLICRTLRHKDWHFIEPAPVFGQAGKELFTGIMVHTSRDAAGHGCLSLQVKLESLQDRRMTVVLEW